MTPLSKRCARQAAFSTAMFDRADIRRLNRAASMTPRVSTLTRLLPFDSVTAGTHIIQYMVRIQASRATVARVLAEGLRIIMEGA